MLTVAALTAADERRTRDVAEAFVWTIALTAFVFGLVGYALGHATGRLEEIKRRQP